MRRLQKENKKLDHMRKGNSRMRVKKHCWNTVKKAACQPTVREGVAKKKSRKSLLFFLLKENKKYKNGHDLTLGHDKFMISSMLSSKLALCPVNDTLYFNFFVIKEELPLVCELCLIASCRVTECPLVWHPFKYN